MTADVVAAVVIAVATVYAVLAGADFGGGVWDLLAGSTARGQAPRRRIDQSITPVWESNHVWLIIAIVVLWTSFPAAFADIFTTLFVPLSAAALGIVLRGSGFAFRAQVRSLRWQAVAGGLFAFASLLTPFFLGTVIGAVVTGRVTGRPGDPAGAWTNLTSLLTGALFVATGAYLAAVYLAADSERAGEQALRAYFVRRAIAAGAVSGILAGAAMAALHSSARPLFTELTTGRGLPLVVISVAAGLAVPAALLLGHTRLARPLAALAVAAVIWGWAIAQYPDILPPRLTIADAAAPRATLAAELVVVAVIAVLVAPSLALLFRLATGSKLGEAQDAPPPRPTSGPAEPPPGRTSPAVPGYSRLVAGIIVAVAAGRALRRSRHASPR